ncbi:17907_t:CDS:2 [Cetraspora pellucida]|uniref:17907_t:CDS:1 n=1 Tax=Cetraspora pellucida TaxID=1433469 RepID=A0A9N8ZLS7_9GLOM|nr:17907_t:CDS:2 [Cetraspora pellucida]
MHVNTVGVEAYPSGRVQSFAADACAEENDEYEDDWERYKDFKNDIKVNSKVKKRKREAHMLFHERLDNGIDDGKHLKQRNATNNSNISQKKAESTTVNNNELALQVASRITTLEMNNELEAYAKETIRDDGKRWAVCKTDIRDMLTNRSKKRLDCTLSEYFYKYMCLNLNNLIYARIDVENFSLAFYDIIDVTPGSNSDFVRSLPDNVVHEIRQSKSLPTPGMDNIDGMKEYIIGFIKTENFHNYVNESYLRTRVNNTTKFIWDYLNLLGKKSLFASSEDHNQEKDDGEDRNAGRKIDIIWSMKPTDLEFSIGEINNEIMVYEMLIPFHGLYVFCKVLRSKLPTNRVEVGLILRSISVLLKFKELLERSLTNLKSYIQDACTRTPDNENADLFITLTDLMPIKK